MYQLKCRWVMKFPNYNVAITAPLNVEIPKNLETWIIEWLLLYSFSFCFWWQNGTRTLPLILLWRGLPVHFRKKPCGRTLLIRRYGYKASFPSLGDRRTSHFTISTLSLNFDFLFTIDYSGRPQSEMLRKPTHDLTTKERNRCNHQENRHVWNPITIEFLVKIKLTSFINGIINLCWSVTCDHCK